MPEYRQKYLRQRSWLSTWLLQPLGTAVYSVGVQMLLVLVWFCDKVMFYTRGRKEFEQVKMEYLTAK